MAKCKYILKQEGVPEKDWPVFKSKEALATHLNKTPTLVEALKNVPKNEVNSQNENIPNRLSPEEERGNIVAGEFAGEVENVTDGVSSAIGESEGGSEELRQSDDSEIINANEAEKTEVPATTEGGENMREANSQEPNEIFTQVDDAINKTGVEATAARRELKEKFGTDSYQKAIKITREFDKITDRLEAEGKITKKCP